MAQMTRAPDKHRSPSGWWIASYIERAVWDDSSGSGDSSRCTAWESTIILEAKNRDSAYTKAVRLGSSNKSTFSDDASKRAGRWVFEGLTSLLPIYDDLGDGAEVLWRDHSGRALKSLRAMVKKKGELEAFVDGEDD
jgi:hypothetical protein